MKMEEIENRWCKLSLTVEEDAIINMPDESIRESERKGERSLVGKLYMERIIGKEVLAATLGKIWRVSKAAIFQVCGPNLFMNICYAC